MSEGFRWILPSVSVFSGLHFSSGTFYHSLYHGHLGGKMPRECKSQVNSIKNSSIAMEGVELKCDALRHS